MFLPILTLIIVFQHWDSTIPGLNTSTINEEKVNDWSDMQRSQHLMISFATYLCGMRIRVYRAEGTTQWYTAVSTGYNANTQVNIKVDFWPFDLFYRHEAQR